MRYRVQRPLYIGMVHLAPLAGRPQAPSFAARLRKARADLSVLVRGGMPAVMFENMYDQPHTERLDPIRRRDMTRLATALTKGLEKPFGFSLLWNDYPLAFSLAKKTGAQWIRVPVFVDDVKTAYGIFRANPKAVLAARRAARASSVAVVADVHVKHATILSRRSIAASARLSVRSGADALIVTGTWTGNPPDTKDLRDVRDAVGGNTPLLIGSGLTDRNLARYHSLIDGGIVGTALKAGTKLSRASHEMRAPWQQPLSVTKVRQFVRATR